MRGQEQASQMHSACLFAETPRAPRVGALLSASGNYGHLSVPDRSGEGLIRTDLPPSAPVVAEARPSGYATRASVALMPTLMSELEAELRGHEEVLAGLLDASTVGDISWLHE